MKTNQPFSDFSSSENRKHFMWYFNWFIQTHSFSSIAMPTFQKVSWYFSLWCQGFKKVNILNRWVCVTCSSNSSFSSPCSPLSQVCLCLQVCSCSYPGSTLANISTSRLDPSKIWFQWKVWNQPLVMSPSLMHYLRLEEDLPQGRIQDLSEGEARFFRNKKIHK